MLNDEKFEFVKKFYLIGLLVVFILPLWVNAAVLSFDPENVPGNRTELMPEDFKIFPNPVVNQKFIVETFRQPLSEIKISNITGKVVYQKKLTLPSQRYEVLTENYPDGIYLLRITTIVGATRTIKLMISTHR